MEADAFEAVLLAELSLGGCSLLLRQCSGAHGGHWKMNFLHTVHSWAGCSLPSGPRGPSLQTLEVSITWKPLKLLPRGRRYPIEIVVIIYVSIFLFSLHNEGTTYSSGFHIFVQSKSSCKDMKGLIVFNWRQGNIVRNVVEERQPQEWTSGLCSDDFMNLWIIVIFALESWWLFTQ